MQYVASRSYIGGKGLPATVSVSEMKYTHTDATLYNTGLIINR